MRTIIVEYLMKGTIGDLYKVSFVQGSQVVGYWPIHGEGIGELATDWIVNGKRPM